MPSLSTRTSDKWTALFDDFDCSGYWVRAMVDLPIALDLPGHWVRAVPRIGDSPESAGAAGCEAGQQLLSDTEFELIGSRGGRKRTLACSSCTTCSALRIAPGV